jgi:adenine-specific DNA-methyltransferase
MMEFSKIQKGIFDSINENVKLLAKTFPSAVKDGQVDFEALKAELGQFETVNDKLSERYELGWAGKEDAKRLAITDVVGRTLKYVPEDSKNPDTTENLYIEGDNLEVLKLLRNSYYNRIKMIYIDPPYNTGNDFIYNDKFRISEDENAALEGEVDEYGERLVVNQKSSGRFHSNWLSMMYPRLRIAKDLLTEDGVIFISIDDNEVANLRKICDEIFGEDNFRNAIIIRRGAKNLQSQFETIDSLNSGHEYVLMYTKNISVKFKKAYKQIDDNPLGSWNNHWRGTDRPTMRYTIFGIKPDKGQWRWSETRSRKAIQNYENMLKELNTTNPTQKQVDEWYFKKLSDLNVDKIDLLRLGNTGKPEHYVAPSNQRLLNDLWDDLKPNGSSQLSKLFNGIIFDNPKSIDLIRRLCEFVCTKDSIILDFFSGSATTAHAVMQLNAEDGGNRKFIMVQLPEPCDEKSEAYKAGFKNICEIGKERIRRAGEKIKEENKDKEGIENLDVGFKVFRAADTNIRWISEAMKSDNITFEESVMSDKERLDFNPGFTDTDVVYEILLRHRDIPLSAKVEKLPDIGDRTYIFADAVLVCLEENITESIIDKIAAVEPMPMKIIFRDSAFEDDITLKINTMLRLEAQIKKNSGESKKAYRVEFI